MTTAFAAYAVVPHRADDPTSHPGEVLHADLAALLRRCLSEDPDGYVAGLWDGYGFFAGGTVIHLDTGEQHAVVPPMSSDVMAAPRLNLPGRGYTLFEAQLGDLDELPAGADSMRSQSPTCLSRWSMVFSSATVPRAPWPVENTMAGPGPGPGPPGEVGSN